MSMSEESEKDRVFREYKNTVNMSAKQLEIWSQTKCSKKASLSRRPLKRNIKLLRKKKSEWTKRDFEDAKRTISFINRMKASSAGEEVEGCGVSKKTISLKNWGFDPNK